MKHIFIIILFWLSLTPNILSQTLDITSEDGALWLNGQRIRIKGVSVSGFESTKIVHGLWATNINSLLDFIKNNGFNAIRLAFAGDAVLTPNAMPALDDIDFSINPDLVGLNSLQIFDLIVNRSAERGILILLDMHLLHLNGEITPLWYDGTMTEEKVIQAWTYMVNRYKDAWNIIGLDLKNEPFDTASWGTNIIATDWRLASERIGNALLAVNPKLLMFVEGVELNAVGSTETESFWGENLIGVRLAPVRLSNPKKLVYNSHTYGPSVSPTESAFSDPTFPANMPAIWTRRFGFVQNLTGNALVIGEFGGHVIGKDAILQNALADYMIANNLTNSFYWVCGDDSDDTGGLLESDWVTPIQRKLDLLKRINPNPTVFPGRPWIANSSTSSQQTSTPQTTGIATTRVATTSVATTKAPTTAATSVQTTGVATTSSQTSIPITTSVATTRAATTGIITTAVATTRAATTNVSPTTTPATTSLQSTTGSSSIDPLSYVNFTLILSSSWTSSGVIYRQYEFRIKNLNPIQRLKDVRISTNSFFVVDIWNLIVRPNSILSLPDWLVSNNGLVPGETLYAGFIVRSGVPQFTVTQATWVGN